MFHPHSFGEIPMLDVPIRRAAAAALAILVPLAGCSRSVSMPASTAAPAQSTLLVRLGTDTIAMEQYTRTPTHMEGVLVSRAPVTTIGRYSVDLANGVPTRAEYSVRRVDGIPIPGAMQSLTLNISGDSVHLVGHRATGDTMRAVVARGELIPYTSNSYGLYELALARLRATRRDSAEFALVPLAFGMRVTTPLPVKLYAGDSVRTSSFGAPLYLRQDGQSRILGVDGSRTTQKVRVDRVASTDLDALARAWAAREQTAGALGAMSTRDTVQASVGSARLWVDYGRPALRGRNVWVNGVLGDSIWRTGANAATQLRVSAPVVIGGAPVPAGTYTLFTAATPAGYQLIINKQVGQGGTEYDAKHDLVRVPLREGTTSTPAERFTIAVDPQGALILTWGTKQLSVPISAQ
jgi:hypothetical protein